MNISPRLLILTPTLGTSEYLDESVRAVQALGLRVRHILVCPENRRSELAARFPACETVADAGKSGGLYGALNAGLDASASGDPWEWYTYINDDDLLTPGFADLVRRHCAGGDLRTVAYGDIETVDAAGKSLGTMTVERNPAYLPALLQTGISPTGQQGMIFGAEVVRALHHYDLRYRVCADLEFWARALAAGFPFRYYPLPVGSFRIRPGQISGEVSSLREQLDEVTRVHFPTPVPALQKRLARVRYRLSNLPRYLGRLRAVGFARSLDVLQNGGGRAAKEKLS